MQPYALKTRSPWSAAYDNDMTRQCDVIAPLNRAREAVQAYQSGPLGRWNGSVSPVGSEFIGMTVTLFVVLALLGVGALLGLVNFERRDERGAGGGGGGVDVSLGYPLTALRTSRSTG